MPGQAYIYTLADSLRVERTVCYSDLLRIHDKVGVCWQGVGNLSPYSYFGVMSHDPPYVTIGTCATGGRPNGMKDSQQNILETG